MASETNTIGNGTTTRTARKGFAGLCCPKCGQADGVAIKLEDMGFNCGECSEDFTATDVRKMIASWTKVLEWVEMCPSK